MIKESTVKQSPAVAKITKISLIWKRYFQERLLPYDITVKQTYVLKQLKRKEFLYPSQIADMLFCDRPTATVIIRNMERKGWVTRKKDPQNRKYVRLTITEAGKEKIAVIEQYLTDEPLSDPLSCLDNEEMKELERLLDKLHKHLEGIK